MKSSYRDHLKSKFTPTIFGLFEAQDASLLSKVYAYVYNEEIWSSGAIFTCRGPVQGRYRHVTLGEIQGEFAMYNQTVQNTVLARVNDYVSDFESAKVFPPTPLALERLLEVRNYFQDRINKQPSNTYNP